MNRSLRRALEASPEGREYLASKKNAKTAARRRTSGKRAPGREARATRAQEKRDRRAEVRAACVARADGRCEAFLATGSNAVGEEVARCRGGADEMDHVFGRARAESVDTCWMLCHKCHAAKTENRPSRAAWLGSFTFHAAAYDYSDACDRAERLHDLAIARAAQHPSPPATPTGADDGRR